MSGLEALVDELAERVAAIVLDRLRAGACPGWVDQASSPLGRRRHCSVVRCRQARGEAGASIVGRRHLLSAEALAEELGRATGEGAAPAAKASGVREELARELAQLRIVR